MDKQTYKEDTNVSSFDKLKPRLNVITTGAVVLGLITAFQEKIAETEKTTNLDDNSSMESVPAQAPTVEQYDQELYRGTKARYESIVSLAWRLYPYYRGPTSCIADIPLLIEGKNWTLNVRETLPSDNTYTQFIQIPITAMGCYSADPNRHRTKKFILTRQTEQAKLQLTFPIGSGEISMYLHEYEGVTEQQFRSTKFFYREKGPNRLIASVKNGSYCDADNPFRIIVIPSLCDPNQNPKILNKWLIDIERALIAQPARAQAAKRAAQDKAAADALKALEEATK